jgi:hypothetical protein
MWLVGGDCRGLIFVGACHALLATHFGVLSPGLHLIGGGDAAINFRREARAVTPAPIYRYCRRWGQRFEISIDEQQFLTQLAAQQQWTTWSLPNRCFAC